MPIVIFGFTGGAGSEEQLLSTYAADPAEVELLSAGIAAIPHTVRLEIKNDDPTGGVQFVVRLASQTFPHMAFSPVGIDAAISV